MATQANVRSIDALVQLKSGFSYYSIEAQAALQRIHQELIHTKEWLFDRQHYWQVQVQNYQRAYQQAQAELYRCQDSLSTDIQGYRHASYCWQYEDAVIQARTQLRVAEDELRTARYWLQAVDQAAQVYQRQSSQLSLILDSDLAKAQTLLAQKINSLQAYLALSPPETDTSFLTIAPLDELTNKFADTLALGTFGIVGPAIYLVHQMTGNIRAVLGDIGETLVTRLLEEQFGWQEVAFDQPKHGFDRLFKAPGFPLIVVESKVNQKGKLRLGQTQSGEQGSAEWIAFQTAKMADPHKAQYSPRNAQIAALIQELGAENIPVVTVVIQTETGTADIYYRVVGAETWQELSIDVSLDEAISKVNSQPK